jgi:hypothetical protein
MQGNADLLDHAKAAVERTERSLATMRARLQTSARSMGRQHRLLIDGALRDLTIRQEALTVLYEAMLAATADQLPSCWQKFFTCYDDYLEVVRDIRSRLIQDESYPSNLIESAELPRITRTTDPGK